MKEDADYFAQQITLTEGIVRQLQYLISPGAEAMDDSARLTKIIQLLSKAPEL